MSEFFDEYTHIMADPRKQWPYFDIPGCLKMLSWSVDECGGRIYPRWYTKDGFTRHAVVQLAIAARTNWTYRTVAVISGKKLSSLAVRPGSTDAAMLPNRLYLVAKKDVLALLASTYRRLHLRANFPY
jgi:hypothetical protein